MGIDTDSLEFLGNFSFFQMKILESEIEDSFEVFRDASEVWR